MATFELIIISNEQTESSPCRRWFTSNRCSAYIFHSLRHVTTGNKNKMLLCSSLAVFV